MSQNIQTILNSMDAVSAAKFLLGAELVREINGDTVRVRIVETEAYHQVDAASHSYSGRTPRTDVMFGPAAHLYVYFTYGMHYCCNVVIGEEGYGAAVLIRAVEPIEGEAIMLKNRAKSGVDVCNGPAKLCQALLIDKKLNGHDLEHKPLVLYAGTLRNNEKITQTTRIGISKAQNEPWRFYISGNPYVSRL